MGLLSILSLFFATSRPSKAQTSRLVRALLGQKPQSKAHFITPVHAFFFRGATVQTGENVSCYLPIRLERYSFGIVYSILEQIKSSTLDTWVVFLDRGLDIQRNPKHNL